MVKYLTEVLNFAGNWQKPAVKKPRLIRIIVVLNIAMYSSLGHADLLFAKGHYYVATNRSLLRGHSVQN
jgi:hypothetical protein